MPIEAPSISGNSPPAGLEALAQAYAGRTEVEIRPVENGIALVLRAAAPQGSGLAATMDFVGELTRETRTAVTTILHALEMAAEASAPGERVPWVETVEKAVRGLLRRVDYLAEFGQGSRRKQGQSVTFDPMALLRGVMESASARALERGIALEAAVYGELPDRVQGDATSLRRVMRNLLTYSVEAAGAADWALHFERGDEAHRVRLEVGYAGECPQDLAAWLTSPRQADSLQRADALQRDERWAEADLSLGLARRLVEDEMGGRFTLDTGDAGTRFVCEFAWLPVERAAVEPRPNVKLSGCSVLAVTPDKSLRKVLQMRYAALGLRAMTVESAEEAKRLLAAAVPEAFDLVLVQYSRQEALEFARWLAAHAQWSRLPRLMVSMAGEPGQAATAEEAGYRAYLTPPLPLDLVRDACTALLARAAAGAGGDLITRFSLAEAASARAKES